MKNKKLISIMFVSLLLIAVSVITTNVFAQTKVKTAMMKDCCMMKDGKMMQMKSGKMMPMDKDMTMKNGTKVMTNGDCIMKNGEKMTMKEGECMDMNGKMDNCDMMHKDSKSTTKMKNGKHDMATMYTCPMHPEVVKDKAGKCPKCGMDLVVKK
jgi:hypothetical protein